MITIRINVYRVYIYLNVVFLCNDLYKINVGKYTVCPMDPMGVMKLTCRYNVLVGFPEAEKSHGCFLQKTREVKKLKKSLPKKKCHFGI